MNENREDENDGKRLAPDFASLSDERDHQKAQSGFGTRSTGPRSRAGKRVSSRNATKYRIFSSVVNLDGESQAHVDFLRTELRKYFQPEGGFEEILVDKLAALFWRQHWVVAAETALAERLKEALLGLDDGFSRLELLMRYETSLGREIDRVLAQFERHRQMRLGQPTTPRLDVNLSHL
jgi:hypothetical protein